MPVPRQRNGIVVGFDFTPREIAEANQDNHRRALLDLASQILDRDYVVTVGTFVVFAIGEVDSEQAKAFFIHLQNRLGDSLPVDMSRARELGRTPIMQSACMGVEPSGKYEIKYDQRGARIDLGNLIDCRAKLVETSRGEPFAVFSLRFIDFASEVLTPTEATAPSQ